MEDKERGGKEKERERGVVLTLNVAGREVFEGVACLWFSASW